MRQIVNKILPPKGFIAINLFGVLFVREEYKEDVDKYVLNHEEIHTAQMREMGYVLFYIVYYLEWLLRLCQYGFGKYKAYYHISFEREAFEHEYDLGYLSRRKHFSQWRKNM